MHEKDIINTNKNMSLISKTISLRVPPDLIYRTLKDTRLESFFLNSLLESQENYQLIK
jgi:hypothetical protein